MKFKFSTPERTKKVFSADRVQGITPHEAGSLVKIRFRDNTRDFVSRERPGVLAERLLKTIK